MLKQLKLRAAATAAAAATGSAEVSEVEVARVSVSERKEMVTESKVKVKQEVEVEAQVEAQVEVKDLLENSSWVFACQHLLRALMKTPNSAPFRAPVKGARGYKEVVTQPMDFGTIAKKLGKGKRAVEYTDIGEFAADMRLVFSNCFLYNKGELQNYPVLTWARELRQVFEYEFEQLLARLQTRELDYYPQVAYEYTALLNRLALRPCRRVNRMGYRRTLGLALLQTSTAMTMMLVNLCKKQVLERPARLVKVMRALKDQAKKKKMGGLRIVEGVPRISERIVTLAHDEEYVSRLKLTSGELDMLRQPLNPPPAAGSGAPPLARQLTGVNGDTFVVPASFKAAMHAASCVCTAVDYVVRGRCTNAFCAVRPPGHHAGVGGSTRREEPIVNDAGEVVNMCGQGFCLLNNVGIGAMYALEQFPNKIQRVVIVDWDLHHGNGTQEICEKYGQREDGKVCLLFLSVHAAGKNFFPCTGSSFSKSPCVINVPIPLGSGREKVLDAFETHFRPAIDEFKPNLIMVSAGFDMHKKDLMGSCKLESATYRELTALIRQKAAQFSENRLVSVMEGGYNVNALAECVSVHVEALWDDNKSKVILTKRRRSSGSVKPHAKKTQLRRG